MFLTSPRRRRHLSFFFSTSPRGKWRKNTPAYSPSWSTAAERRSFRSEAALDVLRRASLRGAASGDDGDAGGCGGGGINRDDEPGSTSDKGSSLVLYNYPSFTGAFAALFARLYHSHLRLPFLVLPFSSVEPFRVEDLRVEGIETCYLLDFIGPKRFAVELSQIVPRVVAFDHRKSALARILEFAHSPENLKLHVSTQRSSARAVYDYFSMKLSEQKSLPEDVFRLLNPEDEDRVNKILRYIEDSDLRQWDLPDIKAFNIGLREERSKLNCLTNPYVFEQVLQLVSTYNLSSADEFDLKIVLRFFLLFMNQAFILFNFVTTALLKQLLEMDPAKFVAKGNSYICSRQDAAKKLLGKAFKIRLGRGFYGECLCVRADGHSYLSHEIGDELSKRSAAVGLRPLGAVVFMQHGNLKMCLRSTDGTTDASEVAKAYGGGGKFSSSSFIIRMDEYNHWTPANSS